jgi:hypothetical protein
VSVRRLVYRPYGEIDIVRGAYGHKAEMCLNSKSRLTLFVDEMALSDICFGIILPATPRVTYGADGENVPFRVLDGNFPKREKTQKSR